MMLDLRVGYLAHAILRQVTHDVIKKFVILSDSEGSSSISMAAVQGEEDASCLSMTNGKCNISFRGGRF